MKAVINPHTVFWFPPSKLNTPFFFKTWTGRILLINTVVFICMCIVDKSFFLPSMEVLEMFGAKDNAKILQGEYWRFITPMFVHIGIIHFLLNSVALFYIGDNMEKLMGPKWFLTVYLCSGLVGVFGSFLFSPAAISAGASGAIFGLIGVGFYIERCFARFLKNKTGYKLRKGAYTSLVIINILLGFMISTGGVVGIDNAAHLGGLLTGMVVAFIFMKVKKLAIGPA